METLDLISLVVDYEVPPSIVMEAISDRRLTPVVTAPGPPTLETVAFPQCQVENLFWAYRLKYKDREVRAELARRLHRYDGIVSGIIGAVVGSGFTLAASATVEALSTGTGSEDQPARHESPDDLRPEEPLPEFAIPLEPPFERFTFGFLQNRLSVSHQASFLFTAAADGLEVQDCEQEGHITIRHGGIWMTHYSAEMGSGRALVRRGARVSLGDPIIEILAASGRPARGTFSLFRMTEPGMFKPLHLAHLPWPILPSFRA